MNTHDTIAGKTYVVTSKVGCTITDASGELEETCEPGKQKVIHAPSEKLFTSAPAVVRETFNRAALALGQPGGGTVNPYGEISSWAELAVLLPAVKDPTAKVTVTLPALVSRDANVVNVDELVLTIPRKTEGLDLILQYIKAKRAKVLLPKMTTLNQMLKHNNIQECAEVHAPEALMIDGLFRQDGWAPSAKKTDYYLYAPKATKITNCANQLSKLGLFECYAPSVENIHMLVGPMRYSVYSKTARLKLTLGNVHTATEAFDCCKHVPDEDFPRSWSYLKYGSKMFNACELGGALSVDVLNSLQTATEETGTNIWCITMGIHVDHQTDEEVLAAIEGAETKGWTVTVQWNGTPGTKSAAAASTWGLRRMPVYVRLGEPMADGTPTLDWGHYVTNAEENGYTEFASLEEAKEYFNITD